jgi:hypothetical protein
MGRREQPHPPACWQTAAHFSRCGQPSWRGRAFASETAPAPSAGATEATEKETPGRGSSSPRAPSIGVTHDGCGGFVASRPPNHAMRNAGP